MGRGSFGGNMLIASTWRHREEMKRIGKGNADRRWDVLPQQPALAYDIAQNRLIVTAAMLQAPVLDLSRPLAVQFGAFGGLVGHQITRAIDAKGRLIDAKGELRAGGPRPTRPPGPCSASWPRSTTAAPGRAEGAKVNGKLTRPKTWATWPASRRPGMPLPGPAECRRRRAQGLLHRLGALWAQQISPSEAAQRAVADLRAPGQWRVDGPLANLPAFGATFSCKAGQPMQRPKRSRCASGAEPQTLRPSQHANGASGAVCVHSDRHASHAGGNVLPAHHTLRSGGRLRRLPPNGGCPRQ
jgi:putative endopeptidase